MGIECSLPDSQKSTTELHLNQINSVHIVTNYFFKINHNIIL